MSNKEENLVSIAMCTYNGERYLDEQLNTVLEQDFTNLEVVVVDDCSTDKTVQIVEKYALNDRRVKLFKNDTNLGIRKNFEKALGLCSGDYIAIADQDDVWDRSKISKMYYAMGDNVLLYHDSSFIDGSGMPLSKKISDYLKLYRGGDPRAFLLFNCVSGHSVFFTKKLLKYLFPFPAFFPYDMWIAYVATHFGEIDFLEEALVNYRIHDSNATDLLRKRPKADRKKRSVFAKSSKMRNQTMLLWAASTYEFNAKSIDDINNLYLFSRKRFRRMIVPEYSFQLIKSRSSVFITRKKSAVSTMNLILANMWGLKAKMLF